MDSSSWERYGLDDDCSLRLLQLQLQQERARVENDGVIAVVNDLQGSFFP